MADIRPPLALISDIHGNLEALQAVLADIEREGVRTLINLGDVVGYGPDPEACIDLVSQRCALNLCGNHDYAVLHEAEGFNPVAKGAVDFVRAQLDPKLRPGDAERQRRWTFLETLEPVCEADGFEAMHASPRQPVTEYVLPSDPEMDPFKLQHIFAAMHRNLAFVGHTHYPGVIEEHGECFLTPISFSDMQFAVHPGKRAIVNIGSVGQPRDRDARACYVLYRDGVVTWRRVVYDLETTIQKVHACEGLHDVCGLRLREGR